jgi:mono/diheme cytochrome c family protein
MVSAGVTHGGAHMTSRDDTRKPSDYTFYDMNTPFMTLFGVGVAALTFTAALSAQHHSETHRHPEAAKLKNPVAATADSLAAGRKLYDRHCSECHGDTGKGDGMAGEGLDQKPSNFTDAKWEHGSTDGEMFVVVRDGAGPKSEMKSFSKKLSEKQMWDVVNYVRTLGPKATTK